MDQSIIRALLVFFAAYCFAQSGLAADNVGRCERLFKEPAEIATCNTISNLRGGNLSEEELHEIVSRQLYGRSPEELQKEAAKRAEERRKAEPEREAALIKSDQCYRLFFETAERESCRILRMLSMSERSDEEMRQAVRERIERERKEEQKKRADIAAEKKRQATAIEFDRRRREEAKQSLDAQLKKGPIGFSLNRWERGGFGTVMSIRFTLQNNSGTPQKDFVIGCTTHGNSGTQLNMLRRTLYERLEPGAQRAFELNLGPVDSQSARASCGVFGSVAG